MSQNRSWSLCSGENELLARLRKFEISTGYPIYDLQFLRKIGPPVHFKKVPPRGSEVFVSRLPQDVLGDELFWFFRRGGEIYDVRLMLRPSRMANRGFAYVRYTSPEAARNAVRILGNQELRPLQKICIKKSEENNRLFIYGVPLEKTKSQIWEELIRNGVNSIVDVIVYMSYYRRSRNRGFAFVEFSSHNEAAGVRRKYNHQKQLRMWGVPVCFDWSKPMVEVDPEVMNTVTRVFLRNLTFCMSKIEYVEKLAKIVDIEKVEKVYKKKNYSFVHFINREAAEAGLEQLTYFYRGTDVEVMWSIPPSEAKKKIKELPPRFQNPQRGRNSPTVRRLSRRRTSSTVEVNSAPSHSQPATVRNRISYTTSPLWTEENMPWYDANNAGQDDNENFVWNSLNQMGSFGDLGETLDDTCNSSPNTPTQMELLRYFWDTIDDTCNSSRDTRREMGLLWDSAETIDTTCNFSPDIPRQMGLLWDYSPDSPESIEKIHQQEILDFVLSDEVDRLLELELPLPLLEHYAEAILKERKKE